MSTAVTRTFYALSETIRGKADRDLVLTALEVHGAELAKASQSIAKAYERDQTIASLQTRVQVLSDQNERLTAQVEALKPSPQEPASGNQTPTLDPGTPPLGPSAADPQPDAGAAPAAGGAP